MKRLPGQRRGSSCTTEDGDNDDRDAEHVPARDEVTMVLRQNKCQ